MEMRSASADCVRATSISSPGRRAVALIMSCSGSSPVTRCLHRGFAKESPQIGGAAAAPSSVTAQRHRCKILPKQPSDARCKIGSDDLRSYIAIVTRRLRAPIAPRDRWHVVDWWQQAGSGLSERDSDQAAQAHFLSQLISVLAVGETGRRQWTDAVALYLRPAPLC